MPFSEDVGVEDAEDGLLPERGGHGGHAQLDLAPALLALDAAVLGAALLREVAAGEELDARDHRLVDDPRDQVDVVEDAVDAQPHEGELALGLEVDVGGPLLEGVGEDVVEGLDHGRGRGVELLGALERNSWLPRSTVASRLVRELLLRGLQAGLQVVEALVDGLDVAARRHHPLHLEAGDALDVVVGEGREGVVDGDRDRGRRSCEIATMPCLRAKGPAMPFVTTSRSRSRGLIFT